MEIIKEITFDEIKYYWRNFLWSRFDITNSVDLKTYPTCLITQKDYSYRAFKYMSRENIEKIQNPTFVAYEIDGEIVGVESGFTTNINYYRLRGLWVNNKYRRRGIATKLLDYLIERSNKKNIWTIPRESALSFYEKYGFTILNEYYISIYGKTYFAVKKI